MTVEYNLPETRFTWDPEIDGVPDALPPQISHQDEQKQIYSTTYDHLLPTNTDSDYLPSYKPSTPLEEFDSTIEYEDNTAEKHKVMSASDFELADKVRKLEKMRFLDNLSELLPTEGEAKAAIKGVAGHTLTALFTELERQVRNGQMPTSASLCQPGLKTHEREYIEHASEIVLSNYDRVDITQVPHIASRIWANLRDQYVFVKKIPNSTKVALLDGSKFPSWWVADQWNSNDQLNFERNLIDTHALRIERYMDQELFEHSDILLSLQSDPNINLEIEKLMITHVDLGMFKLQLKGQGDYVLSSNVKGEKYWVIIDDKYGDPAKLFNISSRMQVLIYSHGLTRKNYGKKLFNEMRPHNVMFLYRVIDVNNLDIFYKDATILPDEYQEVMTQTRHHGTLWWLDYDNFRELKQLRDRSIIMPHLPEQAELTRASQAAMFLV